MSELKKSQNDISDMRNDDNVKYQYKSAFDVLNPCGFGAPNISGIGTEEVTMYVEDNIANQIHESRHGGDAARGELTATNYNIQHEVSAYKAQFSILGEFSFIPGNNYNDPSIDKKLTTEGILSFKVKITNIYAIMPVLVRMIVDNPGKKQEFIYNF